MSTNPFGAQLTNLGLPPALDAATLAARAIESQVRRIRSLARRTILLWILDIVLVPALWMPFSHKMKEEAQSVSRAVTIEQLAKPVSEVLTQLPFVSGWILGIMTMVSLLAAISTVRLVLTARRVTLEQLSLGLSEVSEQLRKLEPRP